MSKLGHLTILLDLVPISRMTEEDAGEYAFIADGEVFGLAKLKNGVWLYPGGVPCDIVPTHFRPAGAIIAPRRGIG